MAVLIRKKISGKILSRVLSIPSELKNEELEITIRQIKKPEKKFSKLYSSPVKVDSIIIPLREKLNDR
jgi:hypothetical protein